MKKNTLVFVFQKYVEIWSILLGLFIKHKHLISEECCSTYTYNYVICTYVLFHLQIIRSFHLTDEPKWRPGLKNQFYGFISGTSNLTCEAIAEPPATFIWYDKEGQPIREGMILTEDSKSTLVVMLTVGKNMAK